MKKVKEPKIERKTVGKSPIAGFISLYYFLESPYARARGSNDQEIKLV